MFSQRSVERSTSDSSQYSWPFSFTYAQRNCTSGRWFGYGALKKSSGRIHGEIPKSQSCSRRQASKFVYLSSDSLWLFTNFFILFSCVGWTNSCAVVGSREGRRHSTDLPWFTLWVRRGMVGASDGPYRQELDDGGLSSHWRDWWHNVRVSLWTSLWHASMLTFGVFLLSGVGHIQ